MHLKEEMKLQPSKPFNVTCTIKTVVIKKIDNQHLNHTVKPGDVMKCRMHTRTYRNAHIGDIKTPMHRIFSSQGGCS